MSSDPHIHLIEKVRTALQRHAASGQLWLGYSGGLDSSVLLHLLASAGIPVRALHIHHGLSPQADVWQTHCESQARALAIECQSVAVAVDSADGGLEQGARVARYRAFEKAMAPGDQILLAHHGDDQVETFLLRLLRGAGVQGLAAMAEYREFAPRRSLLRPLLGATRGQLEAYARQYGLDWIEDESNQNLNLDRNYLRSVVVPAIAERWPVARQVARAADNLRESAELLDEVAAGDLQVCDVRRERFGLSVDLVALNSLSLVRRKNLLRGWVRSLTQLPPESAHLEQLLGQLNAAEDTLPEVGLSGLVARRFRDRLYLTPQLQPLDLTGDAGGAWEWDGLSDLVLPGGWTLSPSAGWPAADYRICFRRGGERAQPRARAHSQTLKKLLQEYVLEPWLRDRVPLVYRNEQLVAVGDLFVTAAGPSLPPIWRFLD